MSGERRWIWGGRRGRSPPGIWGGGAATPPPHPPAQSHVCKSLFTLKTSSTQNQTSSIANDSNTVMCLERPALHIRSAAQPPLQPVVRAQSRPPCSLLPSPPLQPAARAQPPLVACCPARHCSLLSVPTLQPAAQPAIAAYCPCPPLQPAAQPTLAACCLAHPCSLLPSPPLQPASKPTLAACCPAHPYSLLPRDTFVQCFLGMVSLFRF